LAVAKELLSVELHVIKSKKVPKCLLFEFNSKVSEILPIDNVSSRVVFLDV